MKAVVQIGDRRVGDGERCFISAEIGINHNGDTSLAREMIDAAAEAGADGVKFQNYRTEDFLSEDSSLTHEYVSQGQRMVESQFTMFKRCELDRDTLRELKEHCDGRNIVFHSTPTSTSTLADLVDVGALLLKNGSDYLTHLPLIEAMARTGLPTVLATGMSTLAEIDDAVRAYRGAGGDDLVLLHCTSSYPTPDGDVHLRKIPALRAAIGCPVGLSDHSRGIVAGVGAVVLGACMVEKHFTLSRDLPGPDHEFSMTPEELRDLVASVRSAEQQLGRSEIGPTEREARGREGFRLSCTAAADLEEGRVLSVDDIALQRPGDGIPPREMHHLPGRCVRVPLKKGQTIRKEDLS